MALSENLARIEPWLFLSSSADSWIYDYDAFAGETETLTEAISKSLTGGNTNSGSIPDLIVSNTAPTPRKNAVRVSGGKLLKRKSRASKQSQTTFIAADPANFRQMVQQMTGVRFGNSQISVAPPEPQRPGIRTTGAGLCLPTLDTSAFLLDHHHHQHNVTMGSAGSGAGPLGFHADEGNAGFETISSFPTLESWKVM